MDNFKLLIAFFLFINFFSFGAQAQDFVYEPKNPSFGGNTFNYQWMLSSAQAQNKIEEKSDFSLDTSNDPLKDFQESLNRQILGQLSRQLVANQFGTGDSLQPGEYTIGSFQISITDVADGVSIVILDTSTGNQTTVVIPFGG
jgi:curli production assembly/transport component CsgF